MTSWAAKTSRTLNPTIQEVIDPILVKYGFGDRISRDAIEKNMSVTHLAYQAAINTIALQQPYCDDMNLYNGLGLASGKAADAVQKALLAKGLDESAARNQALSFFEELEAACTQLAQHYKPKEGLARTNS